MATQSSFVIRQLTGPRRELRLTGRALPYRPFTLTSTQRVEAEWYPGSPEATLTVLGTQEEESTVRGAWKDLFLGSTGRNVAPFQVDTRPIQTARLAESWLDRFRAEGQEVEVTWDMVVRRGVIKTFQRSWLTSSDLEYEITFVWSGRAAPGTTPSATPRSVRSAAGSLLDRYNELLRTMRAGFAFAKDIYGDVMAACRRVYSTITAILDTATGAADALLTPIAAARRMVSLTSLCVDTANTLAETVVKVPAHELRAGFSTEIVGITRAAEEFGATLTASVWRTNVAHAARALAREAAVHRAALLKNVDATLVGTYFAKDGDDLRDVARAFYNDPSGWRELMVFNGLRSAELQPQQMVLVPARSMA